MSRDISLLLAASKKTKKKRKNLIKYDEEKLTANAFLSYTSFSRFFFLLLLLLLLLNNISNVLTLCNGT